MNTNEGLRNKSRAWWWGLLALLILVLACLWVNGRRIPQDISRRATEAVTAAGASADMTIGVDGRDVVLAGEIGPMVDRAGLVKTLQSLPGVRTVTDRLVLAKLEPARFSLKVSEREAAVAGLMPDREAAGVLEKAAAALFGEERLTGEIETKPGIEAPAWQDALATLIPELKGAAPAGIEAGPAGLILTGTVPSETQKKRIGQKAEALLAGLLTVDNRIQVAPPPPQRPARLSLRLAGGEVALNGELSSQAQIDRVLDAVRSAFGEAKIATTLEVSGSVAKPVWLEPVLRLMPELALLAQAGLKADADGITLDGTADSGELRERIEKKAKSILGETPLANRIKVAARAAVAQPQPAAQSPAPSTPPPAAPAPEASFPTLYFLHDSTELTAESRNLLGAVVDALRARPDLRVELAGFADSSGEEAYNLGLSRGRAEAVLSYLVSKGIAAGRLVSRGYGEERPEADNHTAAGRALNRRVEFKIVD